MGDELPLNGPGSRAKHICFRGALGLMLFCQCSQWALTWHAMWNDKTAAVTASSIDFIFESLSFPAILSSGRSGDLNGWMSLSFAF